MKAFKRPSGSWTARAYLGTDEDGKPIMKAFTAPDEASAIALAADYQAKHKNRVDRHSLSAAMGAYIRAKEPVLSPSTIRDYRSREKTLKSQFPRLCARDMHTITAHDLEALVSVLTREHDDFHLLHVRKVASSPKTVRNYIGFLSAVFSFSSLPMPPVALPQKTRPDLYIPTEDEIRRLLDAAEGTEMYIPIALGAFAPLRRGEIVALRYPEDFKGSVIHVRRSVAKDSHGKAVEKAPKTLSSDRYIELPDFLIDRIKSQGYITKLTTSQITKAFPRLLDKAGLPHFRFHDLRHFCISYLHTLGIPDVYIMQRSGHSTDSTLRRVYLHTLADHSETMTKKALDSFCSNFGAKNRCKK